MKLDATPLPALTINDDKELLHQNVRALTYSNPPALLTTEDDTTWSETFSESSGFSDTTPRSPRPSLPLYAPGSEIMRNGGEPA